MKAFLFTLVMLAACSSLSQGGRDERNLPSLSATMYGRDDKLAKIDGQSVSGDTYKLWPGRHRVVVTTSYTHCPGCSHRLAGTLVNALPFFVALPIVAVAEASRSDKPEESFTVTSGPLTKCFVARTGHSYHVRTSYQLGTWWFEIVDETTAYDVSSPC